MGGRLALQRADVTSPEGGEAKGATVQVIGSLLRVYSGRRLLFEKEGVLRVERADGRNWRVVMADGGTWSVVRGKGCGCGGGR